MVFALREGLRFLGSHSGLASLLLAVVFTNGVAEALRTLSPVLTERAFGAMAQQAGVLVAVASAGSVAAALTFGRLSGRLTRPALVRLGYALQSACAGLGLVTLRGGARVRAHPLSRPS